MFTISLILSFQHPHREKKITNILTMLIQVNRDNHILNYDCIFTCCLDIITLHVHAHLYSTCVLHVLQFSRSLSLSPPSLLFVFFKSHLSLSFFLHFLSLYRSHLSPIMVIIDPSFITLRSRCWKTTFGSSKFPVTDIRCLAIQVCMCVYLRERDHMVCHVTSQVILGACVITSVVYCCEIILEIAIIIVMLNLCWLKSSL